MHIEFLVEDSSGGSLISEVMKKYAEEKCQINVTYNIKSYKGIGGFNKGKNAQNVKSEHLLTELPKRLRAIQYQKTQMVDTSVFIVLDNDTRDTEQFRTELEGVAIKNNIVMDHVFCIAVEEIEAWLLGDIEAIKKAYPKFEDRITSKHTAYKQDSICGTWEVLADILTSKGIKEFRKRYTTVYEIGQKKIEWAKRIGSFMNIRNNNSPSFGRFIAELDIRRDNSKCVREVTV